MNYGQGFEVMADLVFTGYLIWAAWQDQREMMVVRYTHGLGLLAVLMLAVVKRGVIMECPVEYLLGLSVVMLIQFAAYRCHCYGTADVLVFLMCGLYFLLKKGPYLYFTAYVMVPALSGCLLLMVQMARRNVQGVYLRRPVAYIPYICVAFILTNVVV